MGCAVDGAVARRRLSSCKFIHRGQESKDLPLLPQAVAPPLLAGLTPGVTDFRTVWGPYLAACYLAGLAR